MIGADAVSEKLANSAESVCKHLLSKGEKHGHEWRCGSVMGEAGQSLGVKLAGDKAGVWKDFNTGQSGDLLDLWATVKGLDLGDALADAKGWLGLPTNGAYREPTEQEKAENVARQKVRDKEAAKALAKRVEFVRKLWNQTLPAAGSLVETYLRSRGITREIPPTLRFAPSLKHTPSGRWFPAMVAAVTIWPSREVIAIHRVFLTSDGSGKAPVDQNKMSLGPKAGGAIRLTPPAPSLVVAEGIETALSALQMSGRAVWATAGTGGFKILIVPQETTEIIIAADHDEPGLNAAREAAARWYAEGRTVKIAKPPTVGTDFNDLLRLPKNAVAFPSPEESP